MVRQAHHPEQGRRTDGGSPVELRSITPQGEEAAALPFGRTRGFKPRVRYYLISFRNLVRDFIGLVDISGVFHYLRTMAHSGSAFLDGVKAAIPIWITFVPVSFTLGVAAKTHGLELEEIVLMSALVYFGPAQFAVLEPLGSGKPALQILLTTLLINLRFLVMSAALAPYFRGARRAKVLFCSQFVSASSFLPSYVRFQQQSTSSSHSEESCRNAEENLRYFLGVALFSFTVWVIGSGLGYGVALSVPVGFEEGLNFMLPGYFACMLATVLKGRTMWLIIVASFFAAVPGSLLSSDWGWLWTSLGVVTVGWGLEQWRRCGSR